MALDGRPVWITTDPLVTQIRSITADQLPYGGLPVRFVTPAEGGLHIAMPVYQNPANVDALPVWDVENPPV